MNEAGYRPCRWAKLGTSQVCDSGIQVIDIEYHKNCPQLHCQEARMLQKEREERREREDKEREARRERGERLEKARQEKKRKLWISENTPSIGYSKASKKK